MEIRDTWPITVALLARVQAGADATQISEALSSVWGGVADALAPIIGHRGVAALYRRSLHMAAGQHPWLGSLNDGAHKPMDVPALATLLSEQSACDAVAGGVAVLQDFEALLGSLIGPSLTQRLLAPVWARFIAIPLGSSPSQDNPP